MSKKMGRPKIKIDKSQFEALCGVQCTEIEIADYFNCSVDTIENWCKAEYDGQTFSDVYKKKSSFGKISLRRHQFRMAENNVSMAIFLGKQYLGQRDNPDIAFTDMSNVDSLLREIRNVANR